MQNKLLQTALAQLSCLKIVSSSLKTPEFVNNFEQVYYDAFFSLKSLFPFQNSRPLSSSAPLPFYIESILLE